MTKIVTLSPKQYRGIEALLVSRTTRAAALAIGVRERSLWRWLQQPDFQAEYCKAKQRLHHNNINQLQMAGSEAVDALLKVLRDPDAKHVETIMAARAILELGMRGKELEIEERLQHLEQIARGQYAFQYPLSRT